MPFDLTKPFTEDEVKECRQIFEGMATFKNEGDGQILVSDLTLFYEKFGWKRTPDQFTAYENYWKQHFNGIIPWGLGIRIFSVLYSSSEIIKICAEVYDKNGDGFISIDEYAEYMKCVIIHDEKLKLVSFEDFVKAADTNKDGKVSLEEFGNWIVANSS